MAEGTITSIQLKRGLKAALEAKLEGDNRPLAGEPLWETDTKKLKIGDGVSDYANLTYANDTQIILGYFLNGKFYTDSTYTVEITEKSTKKPYFDLNLSTQTYFYGAFYRWTGTEFVRLSAVEASSTVAGIMKLYNTHGDNTDGTITQAYITEGMNNIKLVTDTADTECLILDLPWD